MSQVCTFLTAYQLLHDGNRLAVLATCDAGVQCLFSDLHLLSDPAAVSAGSAAAVHVATKLGNLPGALLFFFLSLSSPNWHNAASNASACLSVRHDDAANQVTTAGQLYNRPMTRPCV